MLKRVLILLFLALVQFGCGYQYRDTYEVETLGTPLRERLEQEKREFVQIEDLVVGTGPVASWGRRISASVKIAQADGTFIYEGPTFDLVGFKGFPEDNLSHPQLLASIQPGIRLGLNGMAVGGKRRITVDRKMVCKGIPDDAPPLTKCSILGTTSHGPRHMVLKQKLIVEATLTESCIPVRLWAFVWIFHINRELYCRTLSEPKLDPSAPTWR
ncbi:MAG: hypothetical protein OEY86_18840 [Nitrospira sp.]|nr:hypothetical protein [Nitrospira sp.]